MNFQITLKKNSEIQVHDEVTLILTKDTTFDVEAIDEQHFNELVQVSKLGGAVVGDEEVAPEGPRPELMPDLAPEEPLKKKATPKAKEPAPKAKVAPKKGKK